MLESATVTTPATDIEDTLGIPTQGELIPVEELPDTFWQPEESEGRYTARRFFLAREKDYKRCIVMLAAGMGLLKIASLLKVHHRTVAAVRDSEGEKIDMAKQRIRSNLRLAVEVGSERLPEVLESLPDAQLPVALAIAIDKLAQIEGEPTQRIAIDISGKLTHDAILRDLERFPDAKDIVDAEITGLRADAPAQKALTATSTPAGNPTPADA